MTMLFDQKKHAEELQQLIEKSLKKVQGKNENDLCKYLPGPKGGYMHHFTLRKLKHLSPAELFALLQKFIVQPDKPLRLDPKPRAPRGSRKKKDFPNFTLSDIEKVIELARKVGDKDLVARFSPKRPLAALKRELIRSIKENRVNVELWNAYSEAISCLEPSY
jgi:hypothetical protein